MGDRRSFAKYMTELYYYACQINEASERKGRYSHVSIEIFSRMEAKRKNNV